MKTVFLAISTDDNYARYAAAAIASAIYNLADEWKLEVTIFDGGISQSNKKALQRVAAGDKAELRYFDVSVDDYAALPEAAHWTRAMYYRLSVGEALPPHAKRVIYIDCDVLVMSSLHALFEIDLKGAWVAAVENPDCRRMKELGIARSEKYFNSGVLLLDLDVWRKENLNKRALAIGHSLTARLASPDQDILNILFDGNVLFLDVRWNIQVSMYQRMAYWSSIRKGPLIVHYTTNAKPWQRGDPHPLGDAYREAANRAGVDLPFGSRGLRDKFFFWIRWLKRYALFNICSSLICSGDRDESSARFR